MKSRKRMKSRKSMNLTHRRRKIAEVATFERAQAGKVYPAGSTIVQISATRGQTHFLETAGEVEPHYVVFEPNHEILPYYLFIVIDTEIPAFCARYQTGLNIQADAFKFMEVSVHELDAQAEISKIIRAVDEAAERQAEVVKSAKELKKNMLDGMFP